MTPALLKLIQRNWLNRRVLCVAVKRVDKNIDQDETYLTDALDYIGGLALFVI